jgi:transcriptional regulator with XRE-family HTH domain
LAERAAVSQATIAKIEQGATTDPGFTVVAALAAALGLRLDSLAQSAHQAAGENSVADGVARKKPAIEGSQSADDQ